MKRKDRFLVFFFFHVTFFWRTKEIWQIWGLWGKGSTGRYLWFGTCGGCSFSLSYELSNFLLGFQISFWGWGVNEKKKKDKRGRLKKDAFFLFSKLENKIRQSRSPITLSSPWWFTPKTGLPLFHFFFHLLTLGC